MPRVMTVNANKERGLVASDVRGRPLTRSMAANSRRGLAGHGAIVAVALAASALAMSARASAGDCAALNVSFEEAIKKKDIDAAKAVERKIAVDAMCSVKTVEAQRRRAALEVSMAEAMKSNPARREEREQLLVDADKPGVYWTAAYALGEFRFARRQFAGAAQSFEKAIEIVKNPGKTPKSPGETVIRELLSRASQAKLLAANEESGAGAKYVTAEKDDRTNTVGGSLSETVRGVRPASVPLPINFETDSARFTAIGRKAAEELAQAITEQRPHEITLAGHTDERGGDAYNMRLSKARVEAVVRYLDQYLSQRHVKLEIRAEWYGKRRPLQIEDTSGLTQQDIWALNRRVEWKRQ
jgi:outer membrane protein OmpA-like peptidoglycan-associated protein